MKIEKFLSLKDGNYTIILQGIVLQMKIITTEQRTIYLSRGGELKLIEAKDYTDSSLISTCEVSGFTFTRLIKFKDIKIL